MRGWYMNHTHHPLLGGLLGAGRCWLDVCIGSGLLVSSALSLTGLWFLG